MRKPIMTAALTAATALGALTTPLPAAAQAEPFLGQVSLFPYTFCPRGWTETHGQLLAISQNTALFSLLGTTFGGDGKTTFALPDLQSRVPLGEGHGPGLSAVTMGQKGGRESVTITQSEMPSHSHAATTSVNAQSTLHAFSSRANATGTPTGNVLSATTDTIYNAGPADVDMGTSAVSTTANATTTIGNTGGNLSTNIRNPYLGMRWCIAMQGIFPSRN